MTRRLPIPALLLACLSGCGPSYSPDTYATNAAQQANKAEQGVVVGVRRVSISASGVVGTVTGAAAGGIAGAQVGAGPVSAFSSLGGALVGGLAGTAMEHATADTMAYEYIVRKTSGDLVSVTQKDKVPLVLAQNVLVIAGNQARVVPDYTVAVAGVPATTPQPNALAPKAANATAPAVKADARAAPPLPASPAAISPAATSPVSTDPKAAANPAS